MALREAARGVPVSNKIDICSVKKGSSRLEAERAWPVLFLRQRGSHAAVLPEDDVLRVSLCETRTGIKPDRFSSPWAWGMSCTASVP
jgi:hypothetical protein